MDPGPRPPNAQMARLVAMLEEAGLVEVHVKDEGREAYRLTEGDPGRGWTSAIALWRMSTSA